MDENTVFQAPRVSGVQPQSPPLPPAPTSQIPQGPTSIPPQNPQGEPSVPPINPQDQVPQKPPGERRLPSFSVSTIIKIIIGLAVISVILFLIFGVIIPLFAKKSPGKAELTYWGLWEDKSVIQPVIDDFNKKYPDIKINYVKQNIKQYRKKLSARFENNTGPDVFLFHNTWVPMFSDILLPIPTDTISKKDFESSFYPVVQKDLIKNGAIYGIPTEIDTLALYANTDIFQAAGIQVPQTWEDFNNVSRILTVTDETGRIKTAGAALGTFENMAHAPDIISMLFAQNGADIKNFSSKPKNASEALIFYTSFATGDQRVWDSSLDNSMLAFAKENVAMYFGFSWDYFTIKAINPDIKIEVHPVPRINNRNMTTASYWNAGVSAKSKYQKEALVFLKFLTSKESQEKLYSIESKTRFFGEPYARKDLAQKLKDSIAYPFVSQGNNAVSSFFAADTYDEGLNSQMNAYLKNAINSMISENSTSSETAVSTLSQGVSQVLSQYGLQ